MRAKQTNNVISFNPPNIVCELPKAAHWTILSKTLSDFATFIHAKHIVCTPALCFRMSVTAGAANERFAFTLCLLLCVRAVHKCGGAGARTRESRTALEIVPCSQCCTICCPLIGSSA